MWLRSGYPDSIAEQEFPVMIRLAVEVRGGSLQFGDLFWLSDWNPDFPQDQVLSLPDGYYHITACTRRPESGYWGDDQIVCLYFNRLEEMPKLAWQGVPHLFTEEQEADPQDADAQRQPFGLYGWLGMDMSFYSNAADNLAVVMDCGDLQVLYGAASQEG